MTKPRLLTTLACAIALAGGAALAEGDPAKGEKVFNKCKACHMVGEGAKNRVGPTLNGIIGAEIASVEGFKYSDAFLAKKDEGFVWTEEAIAAYLEKPKDYIEGNKMSFAGLRKEADRANVIAYLAQFE